MKRQTVRTLFDIIADINITQCDEKKMDKILEKYELPKNKFIYGLYTYKDNTVYLRKSLNHEEKIRTLFHELAHAYSRNVLIVDGQGDLSEEKVETLAGEWQKNLYGVDK